MKKAWITGAADFIGIYAAEVLVRAGYGVVVLDSSFGDFDERLPQNVTFVPGVIKDHEFIDTLFAQHRFFFVFPLAAYTEARNEVQIAYSSHDNVKRVFGDLIQNVPLDVGIEKMATWVKENEIGPGQRFINIVMAKNMPPAWQKLAI